MQIFAVIAMANITIRNLDDDIHLRLKGLAQMNGRSAEAQVRVLITEAVAHVEAGGFGNLLHSIWNSEPEIEPHTHPGRTGRNAKSSKSERNGK